MRTNLYAYTEAHNQYPAYVSVNREEDGRLTMTVRERGHDGNKTATIELSEETLDAMSVAFLDVRQTPEEYAARASKAIDTAVARVTANKKLMAMLAGGEDLDPPACAGCGAMAGVCSDYPNCPGGKQKAG